ncbi:MAG TPA: hypothetical protein VGM64_06710 [Lacunisphaera sp.]
MKAMLVVILPLLLAAGCSRSTHLIPESKAIVVAGNPSAIYDRVLPSLKARLHQGTTIVRTDDPGVMTMRFSVAASDRSVRLVDVFLTKTKEIRTNVMVHAKKFSFVFTPSRDEIDLLVEISILTTFEKEAGSGGFVSPQRETVPKL